MSKEKETDLPEEKKQAVKVEELRMGNLVLYKGKPLTVAANTFGDVISDRVNGINDYSGIELSPEWLERLGFVKSEGREFRDLQTGWFSVQERDGYYKLATASELIGKQFKHLHQLQNLYFALTGQELKLGGLLK